MSQLSRKPIFLVWVLAFVLLFMVTSGDSAHCRHAPKKYPSYCPKNGSPTRGSGSGSGSGSSSSSGSWEGSSGSSSSGSSDGGGSGDFITMPDADALDIYDSSPSSSLTSRAHILMNPNQHGCDAMKLCLWMFPEFCGRGCESLTIKYRHGLSDHKTRCLNFNMNWVASFILDPLACSTWFSGRNCKGRKLLIKQIGHARVWEHRIRQMKKPSSVLIEFVPGLKGCVH